MTRRVLTLTWSLLVALVAAAPVDLAAAPPVTATTCELPLVIRRTTGEANVMIEFDNSGSMNEPITHASYNPATSYSGRFNRSSTYYIYSTGSYRQRDFNSSWPSTPSAPLVTSDQSEAGWYSGNYLNWIYSHATTAQRAALPQQTRIQVAKAAVSAVLGTSTATIGYGLYKFNDDDGGTMVSPMNTAVTSIQSDINNMRADAATPLAETLVDILDYYKTTGSGAPITASCQKSFVIIVTDGYPTFDTNVPSYLRDYDGDGLDPGNCTSLGAPYSNSFDCTGYLDDVATYMFANDLRPDLDGFQNVTTYVIGMDIDAPILASTASKGGGAYFSARSPAQLSAALRAAMSDIDAKMSAGASVSVVSSEGRTNNRMFRARYESVSWRGFVEAFDLPYTAGDTAVWEAGGILSARNPDTRRVFTTTNGTSKLDFTTTNATTLQSLLGASSSTIASNIIQYGRGNALTGTRDRAGWKLGDIVDSSPLAVGKPASFYNFSGYASYRSTNASRPEVVYVGANDGMMHCFNAADGVENWAYVPKNQLSKIKNLMDPAYCHNYFVNMAPAAYDIYVGGAWKTVLIGGQERGGSGLFAIDVTNPSADNINLMWDVDLPALSGSWNKPELVRDRTRNAFVLAAGTGVDSTTGRAHVLVLDPANGSVVATYDLGIAAPINMATMPTALDRDLDGYDDVAYVGDLTGKVWRLNLTGSTWTVSLLFDNNQPIQSAPVLTMDQQGRVMLYFGTGKYLTDADLNTTSSQSIYAVFDDHSGTTIRRTDLVNQTSAINAVAANAKGWYVDLVQRSGERVIRSPVLVAGTVYVPSFGPRTDVCESGGESWFYSLDYADGSAPDKQNGAEDNNLANRVEAKGNGVLSNPSVDLVNEDIILQSSDTSLISKSITVALQKVVLRSWRQMWD